MSFSWCLQCYLIITLNSFNIMRAVPPTYCLSKMNNSDCNMPPKRVFSYYQPGSRCEIETWRGCPTHNKFDNEYLCSIHCLFRHRFYEKEQKINQCEAPLNTNKCGKYSKTVFTHVNGKCIPALWGGCPSQNKFFTKSECNDVCKTSTNTRELLKLHIKPLQTINKVLKDIIAEEKGNIEEYDSDYEDYYDGEYDDDQEDDREGEHEDDHEGDHEMEGEDVTEPVIEFVEILHV